MKTGYPQAAWRLLQPSLARRPGRAGSCTWADMELAETPFGTTTPRLPVYRARGNH